MTNVKCPCEEHVGKETMSVFVDADVDFIFDCLFSDTPFRAAFWLDRKFADPNMEEWTTSPDDGCKTTRLQYSIDLGALGTVKNIENIARNRD